MNFCTRCGHKLSDTDAFCAECGYAVKSTEQVNAPVHYQNNAIANYPMYNSESNQEQSNEGIMKLRMTAKAFMIVGTILMGIYVFPLAWCLPMTISYSRKVKNGEKVSTGFKVSTLLWVSAIAGVLMLCDTN